MGFLLGFLLGLLVIPLTVAASLYYFFNYSKSYEEGRKFQEAVEQANEQARNRDTDDATAFYAYRRQHGYHGGPGQGPPNIPEHLDPQYQFAGWVSVKRTPEVDHRTIEPSAKKDSKKHNKDKNGHGNTRKGSETADPSHGIGAESWAAEHDPRFNYLDTNNPHMTLPSFLQARFKDSRYVVIKGTTMFIYENDLMQECLGIITIPNYHVSIPGELKDSNIYSKRHSIWLQYKGSAHDRRPTGSSEGAVNTPTSTKDYYLSMVTCVDKEDLYFTLIRCSKLKLHSTSIVREIPQRDSTMYDRSAMDTLIRTIHSNEHQFQAAWLNALIGRLYLGVYKTPQVKEIVLEKLTDKLSRVRMPAFITDLRMRSVHLGDGVPYITRPKLLTLKPNGDMIMDMNLLYQGGFQAEMKAEAVVTMRGVPAIKVSLVLTVKLLRLEGRLQVWVKPPPSNRIWYGFYARPNVDMKIETAVSDKAIRSTLILKAIENKLLEALDETMVLPNMDDIPFSETDGAGGIFGEDIAAGAQEQQDSGLKPVPVSSPNGQRTPRANTINVTPDLQPRRAMDLGSQPLTHSTSLPTSSLKGGSDELMQTNYGSESPQAGPVQTTGGIGDLDPMKIQSDQQFTSAVPLRSVPIQPSSYVLPSHTGNGAGQEPNDPLLVSSVGANDSKHSPGNRLLNRFGHKHTSQQHNRKTSWDLAGNSTPSAMTSGFSSLPTSRYGQLSVSTDNLGIFTEEPRSMYNLPEYEPPRMNEAKEAKEAKKRMKERQREQEREERLMRERAKADGDQASVISKDSADSGSTRWAVDSGTASLGSTLAGAASSSSSASINYAASTRSEKFSFSRLFGLRKKSPVQGTNKMPSPTPFQQGNSSSDALSAHSQQQQTQQLHHSDFEDRNDADSIMMDEDFHLLRSQTRAQPLLDIERRSHDGGISGGSGINVPVQRDGRHKRLSVQQLPTLEESFHVEQRQKFESSPDLTVRDNSIGASLPGQQQQQQQPLTSSPASSVYCPSLFGSDEYCPENVPASRSKSPVPSSHSQQLQQQQQQQQQDPRVMLKGLSPKFAPSLRNLRNRSRGNSGASRTELSIPADLSLVTQSRQLQQLQQQQQSSSSTISSDASLPIPVSSMLMPISQPVVEHTEDEFVEDEQFPRSANGPYVPVALTSPETVYTITSPGKDDGSNGSTEGNKSCAPTTPTIVLQSASPYLPQGDLAPPTLAQEANGGGLAPHGQGGHTLQHQRSADALNKRYEAQPEARRPRRHSINHLPRPPSSVHVSGSDSDSSGSSGSGGFVSPVNIHPYQFGPPPSSPLRNEYIRDSVTGAIVSGEGTTSSSISSATFTSTNIVHTHNSNGAVRTTRHRNKSDSFSQTGVSHVGAEQREYELQIQLQHHHQQQHFEVQTVQQSHQDQQQLQPHHHHSHGGLRNFFANLSSKSKRKGSVSSPTPSSASSSTSLSPTTANLSPQTHQPLHHAATLAADGTYPAITAQNGNGDPREEAGLTNSTSAHECCETLPLQPCQLTTDNHTTCSSAVPALPETDLRTHPSRQESSSTSSCEAMAAATGAGLHTCAMIRTNTWSDSPEAIHARPGWVGEFPTPVRMHSSLNRESARVRAQVELEDELEAGEMQGQGASGREDGRLHRQREEPVRDMLVAPTVASGGESNTRDLTPLEPPRHFQSSLSHSDLVLLAASRENIVHPSPSGTVHATAIPPSTSSRSLPLSPKSERLPDPVTRPLGDRPLPLAIPASPRTVTAMRNGDHANNTTATLTKTSSSSTVSSVETWSISSAATEPTPRLSSSSTASSTTNTTTATTVMARMDREHVEFMRRLDKLDLSSTLIMDTATNSTPASATTPKSKSVLESGLTPSHQDGVLSTTTLGTDTSGMSLLPSPLFSVEGQEDPLGASDDHSGLEPIAQDNGQETRPAAASTVSDAPSQSRHRPHRPPPLGLTTDDDHQNNHPVDDLTSPLSPSATPSPTSPPPTPVKRTKRNLLQRLIRRKSVDDGAGGDIGPNGSMSHRGSGLGSSLTTSLRHSPSLALNDQGHPIRQQQAGLISLSLSPPPSTLFRHPYQEGMSGASVSMSSLPTYAAGGLLGSPTAMTHPSTGARSSQEGVAGTTAETVVSSTPSTPTKTHLQHPPSSLPHHLQLPRVFPAGHAPLSAPSALESNGAHGNGRGRPRSSTVGVMSAMR
ncbi:hypothetical protein BGZ73_006247 [Actinomortierella ambigua]|nr:hypothetical protein BGZ73_006247 [Actinomortierella ambigua]